MKYLAVLLLALASSLATAQNVTLKVLTVFSNEAVATAQANGQTMAQFVAYQLALANSYYAQSGINVMLVNAGIRSGICCGTQKSLRGPNAYDTTTYDIGAVAWATNSIPIAKERDATDADVTVVVTDFQDPNDAGGVSAGLCGHPTKPVTAKTALVGVDIRRQLYQDPMIIAHEIAHINCMWHDQAYVWRAGSTPTDCVVWFTAEMSPNLVDARFGVQQCWKTSVTGKCYSSGHNAIVGIATDAGWQNCTYSNQSFDNVNWTETMSCPYVGFATYSAKYYYTTSAFTCTNLRSLTTFSNPNVVVDGLHVGDASHNTAAVVNQNAPVIAGFHNTKIWKALQAAAWAAAQ